MERKLKPGDLVRVIPSQQLGLVIEGHRGRLRGALPPTAIVLIGSKKSGFFQSSLELVQKALDET